MRCYHICNFYFGGIHAGIQAAHAQHELAIKYLATTPFRDFTGEEGLTEYGARLNRHTDAKQEYIYWANNHKTVILLNGGMHGDLLKVEEFMNSAPHSLAWSAFRESEYAANNTLTDIAIVLREEMYERKYTSKVLELKETCWHGHVVVSPEESMQRNEDASITLTRSGHACFTYSKFDIELIQRLSRMELMK